MTEMAEILDEKFREAACVGDTEAVRQLLINNLVDINHRNSINGWTALHWACKRGNEEVVRLLLTSGADPFVKNHKGETPISFSQNPSITTLFGDAAQVNHAPQVESPLKFVPNYLKNPPLNGHVDLGTSRLRSRHTDFSSMPTTTLPAQTDDLVLKVRVASSSDPDFIEIEVPKWKLTYVNLLKICCEELEVQEAQVHRIRKLPNTRLRKDSDVKRLTDFQSLEIVMKNSSENKFNNGYQSISSCKDQTILY